MTRFKLIRLKNSMMFANALSNAIGICVTVFMSFFESRTLLSPEYIDFMGRLNMIFLPASFALGFGLAFIYERPIRDFLNNKFHGVPMTGEAETAARRRLLNEPFFLIAFDMAIWITAAVFYSSMMWKYNWGDYGIADNFYRNLFTGLITSTIAFFVLQRILQHALAPVFFPKGGLSAIPKTIRIRIGTRLGAMLLACNLVPFFAILLSSIGLFQNVQNPNDLLDELRTSLIVDSLVFICVGFWVTFLVSSNLTRPLTDIIQVLRKIREEQFDEKVRVTTNDEIGYTGDAINEMTEGLKERDFIKKTFGKYVSEEIRDEILSGKTPLDGEIKEVTVLFADLRNFTSLVESTPPREVVSIINEYFKEMEEAINLHNGLVLQYIGDEIEAVFGAPVFRREHPVLAVQAAMEMATRLKKLNVELEHRGCRPLSHGIGIHTGEVVAANIGSPDRLSYTLVGDTVNLASRLQELNKEFGTQIIISGSTRAHLNGAVKLKELPVKTVRGKIRPVEVFALAY